MSSGTTEGEDIFHSATKQEKNGNLLLFPA
jgi:hypothetical protein